MCYYTDPTKFLSEIIEQIPLKKNSEELKEVLMRRGWKEQKASAASALLNVPPEALKKRAKKCFPGAWSNFKDALHLYMSRWKFFALPQLLAGLIALSSYFLQESIGAKVFFSNKLMQSLVMFGVWGLPIILGVWLATTWVVMIRTIYENDTLSFFSCLKVALYKTLSAIWIGILRLMVTSLPIALIVSVLIVLLVFFLSRSSYDPRVYALSTSIIGCVGLLLFFLLSTYFVFDMMVLVVERKKGWASLRRSYEYVRAKVLRVFSSIFITNIIMPFLPCFFMYLSGNKGVGGFFLGIVLYTLFVPIQQSYIYILYQRLKEIKGIELMAMKKFGTK